MKCDMSLACVVINNRMIVASSMVLYYAAVNILVLRYVI